MRILIESKEPECDSAPAHIWASVSEWAEENADQAPRGEDKEGLFIKINTQLALDSFCVFMIHNWGPRRPAILLWQ